MKSFLFIFQQPPHGSALGQEGLDALLMGSAFSDCAVLFLEDGLFQLCPDQETTRLGVKPYTDGYGAIADYGINRVFCREKDLIARQLSEADLLIETKPLDDPAVSALINQFDVILSY